LRLKKGAENHAGALLLVESQEKISHRVSQKTDKIRTARHGTRHRGPKEKRVRKFFLFTRAKKRGIEGRSGNLLEAEKTVSNGKVAYPRKIKKNVRVLAKKKKSTGRPKRTGRNSRAMSLIRGPNTGSKRERWREKK